MLAPQTEVKKITDNCCLFMCYVYCSGEVPATSAEWLDCLSRAIKEGLIDSESTVLDAEKLLLKLTGKRFSVEKKDVKNLSEITKKTPVRFDFNGFGHWVVVENGTIIFNPLLNSNCVNKGKPTTARIISRV